MDKEFYIKYSNDLDCAFCSWLKKCKDDDEPVCVGGLLKHYKDQVKVLEKALELACDKIDAEYFDGVYCTEYVDYFKNEAKEELNK